MELKEVTDFYQADFNKSELVTQLQLLSCMDIKCSITFKISTYTRYMVLHVHNHLTDSINVAAVLNEFMSVNEDRHKSLGHFH